MGQYQQHLLTSRGRTFELAHRNSQASVPFVLSSAGYGFFWHDPSIGRATFGVNRTEWHAESTNQLDYWITAGDDPAQIVRAYTAATGRPPMMPEHGLGFWQCKLRYWNAEQLLDVAREHIRRGLPLDVHRLRLLPLAAHGGLPLRRGVLPGPAAMVAELESLGVELMVSVWPQVSLASENYAEMRENNLLVRSESGVDVQMRFQEPSVFYDATNPAARQYVWEKCRQNYYDLGIRTFWLDEAEPEYETYDFGHYRYHLGPNVQIGNLYPQLYARGFYEGQLAAGQPDPVNLVRCAWAGEPAVRRAGVVGRHPSTWEDFRRQITAGLQMGIAGIPWWTTDIGGFYDGDPEDEGFRELLVRWFQWGAFCPVMRLHGFRLPVTPITHADGRPNCPTGADNEVWSYGEDVYRILASYLHLRERMRPYVRDVMRQAHEHGDPVMRPMFYGFPDDARAWTLGDQYLFGPDLLVAPVVEPGARSRQVYLPGGVTWTELHTGRSFDGGQDVTVRGADGGHPCLRPQRQSPAARRRRSEPFDLRARASPLRPRPQHYAGKPAFEGGTDAVRRRGAPRRPMRPEGSRSAGRQRGPPGSRRWCSRKGRTRRGGGAARRRRGCRPSGCRRRPRAGAAVRGGRARRGSRCTRG